ncbi:helix-turn-helix domain-containing protein [Solibacillus silvestris]|uniref:helix-turn-helix domain-containing protein n=1 Tax=Solibacillus silvestris TaxID=76853 RepID=UPI003F802DD2
MQTFGEYLRDLRGNRSLRDMERLTGISHTYLSSLEKGLDPRSKKERKPSYDVLKKLSVALKVEYHEMLKAAGYAEGAEFEEGNFMLGMVPEEALDAAGDLHLLMTLEDTGLKLHNVKPKYKGRELSPAEREQILKMLEVLFPNG